MSDNSSRLACTVGQRMVRILESYGVDRVFGIPGVHTVELYRGLAGSAVRHITPRHELGAAFMADGYARASGKPGVCLLITGPGLTNASTAMAQALADSVPLLVLTGVNARRDMGAGRGALHELPDQRAFAREVTRFSQTILDAEQLDEAFARAFALFRTARPGPAHLEIPIDLMAAPAPSEPVRAPDCDPPTPGPRALDKAAAALSASTRPLILAGGGSLGRSGDGRALTALADALDAPVVQTINARGVTPKGHALSVPGSPSLPTLRRESAEADIVLAVGTELGPTDYGWFADGVDIGGRLIRLDIDAEQCIRNRSPELALVGDAAAALEGLTERLVRTPTTGAARAAHLRTAAFGEIEPKYQKAIGFLDQIWAALPDARIIGDSTQAVYAGDLWCEPPGPRRWFNAATGFGALGYALPAAIGAQIADRTTPVVCLVGDGGLLFTVGEMPAAVEADAPIILLVWNNDGYGEIKNYMVERGIEPIGVDLVRPDFVALGAAMGWRSERLDSLDALGDALTRAHASAKPSLIDIAEDLVWEHRT